MSADRDTAYGCLLGTMTGESVGACVEGWELGPLRSRYPDEASILAIKPGGYGAATEMTVAVAASLADFPAFNGPDMASRLASGATSARGYGAGTLAALDRLRRGAGWREAGLAAGGRTSFGNAAAARVAPVGLLYTDDAEMLRWVAEESAAITHQHALAAEGAVLQAFAVAVAAASRGRQLSAPDFLLAVGAECQLREYRAHYEGAAQIVERPCDAGRIVRKLGNGPTALGSVVTAAFCFAQYPDSFERAVSLAVSLGGNASAIAAMTGALSGSYLGSEAIPERWIAELERSPVGPDSLAEIARRLAASRPAAA